MTNQTIRQSYISVIANANLTMYEQRLLLMCVQFAQQRLKGVSLSVERDALAHSFNLVELSVNIADIISEGSGHYNHVIKAAQSLAKRKFSYVDRSGNNVSTLWVLRVTHIAGSGQLVLLLDKCFFDTLYNFRKGFVYYDLIHALRLKHPQSVRLYQLINGMHSGGVTYRLDYLKDMFGVTGKYERGNDFVRKYIEVACKELKDAGEGNYFEYAVIKEQRKITQIHIAPIRRASDLDKQASAAGVAKWLPSQYIHILTQHGGFTLRQLNANKQLIERLQAHPLGMSILLDIIQRCRRTRPANPQGYIINAIKSELNFNPKQPTFKELPK